MSTRAEAALNTKDYSDCGDDGCGECDVCKYLEFIEWADGCAPDEASIERDPVIEAVIAKYVAKYVEQLPNFLTGRQAL